MAILYVNRTLHLDWREFDIRKFGIIQRTAFIASNDNENFEIMKMDVVF